LEKKKRYDERNRGRTHNPGPIHVHLLTTPACVLSSHTCFEKKKRYDERNRGRTHNPGPIHVHLLTTPEYEFTYVIEEEEIIEGREREDA
jgi:hypothetical protein